MDTIRGEQIRRQAEPHLEPSRSESDSFASEIARGITTATVSAAFLAAWRRTSREREGNTSTNEGILGRRAGPAMESTTAVDHAHDPQNRSRRGTRGHNNTSLNGSQLVQSLASRLSRLASGVSKRRTAVRIRLRQPGLGPGDSRSRSSPEQILQSALSTALPSTAACEASLKLAKSAFATSTGTTKSSQWKKFTIFCDMDGHLALPAAPGTVLAYVGYLFEEGAVSGASIDHYISAARTRHHREGSTDPCTGTHLADLMRAFKREDDSRGELQDVRAAISGAIIAKVRQYGLQQPHGSVG